MLIAADSFEKLVRGERRGIGASLTRSALWWARLPYAAAVKIRNLQYDRGWRKVFRPPVPVVSVGNLTLGGTGKTPCVEYVAALCRDLGQTVAILSRGYGSSSGPNDEAMLLEENLLDVPHLQGADRSALAIAAVEELECETIVLDDGFQHRRLHRDLDIVLIDSTRPLAKEYLFPRGFLREPVSSLKRAGFVLMTRCDQAGSEQVAAQRAWLAARFPQLKTAATIHRPIELLSADASPADVEELRGKTVAAFCGIANPAAFRRTLADLGASVIEFREFADHHNYTRDDVAKLQTWAANLPAETILVMTQKDGVKLRIGQLGGKRLLAVRVGMAFLDGEEAFRIAVESAVMRDF